MRLRVSHDRHYAWEIIKATDANQGDYLAAANREGEVSRRSVVDWPGNFTLVEWPESEIERELAAHEANGQPVSRNVKIAEYLTKAGFAHHIPHPNDITHIEVLDNGGHSSDDLQTFLNLTFDSKGSAAPEGGAPDPRRAVVNQPVGPVEEAAE